MHESRKMLEKILVLAGTLIKLCIYIDHRAPSYYNFWKNGKAKCVLKSQSIKKKLNTQIKMYQGGSGTRIVSRCRRTRGNFPTLRVPVDAILAANGSCSRGTQIDVRRLMAVGSRVCGTQIGGHLTVVGSGCHGTQIGARLTTIGFGCHRAQIDGRWRRCSGKRRSWYGGQRG